MSSSTLNNLENAIYIVNELTDDYAQILQHYSTLVIMAVNNNDQFSCEQYKNVTSNMMQLDLLLRKNVCHSEKILNNNKIFLSKEKYKWVKKILKRANFITSVSPIRMLPYIFVTTSFEHLW